jgi:hypothetical protein
MTYIDPAEVARVRQISLLDYLQQREPDELVKLGANSYCIREHDSLKLSNDGWYWWSRRKGRYSALDFLINVREMDFLTAVQHLGASGVVVNEPAEKRTVAPRQAVKLLALPPPAKSNDAAIVYLKSRGIAPNIIAHCIDSGLVYQNNRGKYQNVVFVGKDKEGKDRYASIRGISGSFKGEATGSDKRYSFRLASNVVSESVHVFEGAIDALSFATLVLNRQIDWQKLNMLALGGIPPKGKQREQNWLPQALVQYLNDNPSTKHVCLRLDNDEPGIAAANSIADVLRDKGIDVSIKPPLMGKDTNEWLLADKSLMTKQMTCPKEQVVHRAAKDSRER